ncbi:C39 family peptidase [Halobacillus salinarum]|uniref:C39 family peptidase n=1 Tax=Halobacillus salinarum TaxID=2932257 RepID=UPI0037BF15F0
MEVENGKIFKKDGEIYVPARLVIEQMGDSFQENILDRTVVITTKSDRWELRKEDVVANKDGKWVPLVPAEEKTKTPAKVLSHDGSVFLPLAFVEKSLDYPVKKTEGLDRLEIAIGKAPAAVEPLDVPLINQMDDPTLYNGCEVTSLAMVLNYFNIDVTKNQLADNLPRVPLTYANGKKGNPNLGFVGNLETGPGLTVYHGPMFKLAKQYVGSQVKDLTGSKVQALYDQLAEGRPVWIIINTRFKPVNNWESWATPQGTVQVTYSVHSVVLTGYSKNQVFINNPYGQKNQAVNRSDFEKAWEQMGSQAIVVTK